MARTSTYHHIDVLIKAKSIDKQSDVDSHIWLNYRGDENANEVQNDKTANMSFDVDPYDIVSWHGVAIENTSTSKGVLTDYDNDDDYTIVMTSITADGGQPDIFEAIGTNGSSRMAGNVKSSVNANTAEEFTIGFSIFKSNGQKVGDFTFDPVITVRSAGSGS